MRKAHHPLRGYPAPNNGGARGDAFSGSPIIGGGGGYLLGILAVSLILSVLFAARLPLDANPDEAAHRDYVRLLLEERGFVRFVAGDPARFETHQPPLYYLLCVPVYAATNGSVFALRLVAALLQLATICIVFRACRELFPERADLALGSAAFAAFLPTQARLSGAINNDALTTLVCAAIFWRLGLLVKRGGGRRDAAVLAALLGVGLWTKLSVLQLVPAMGLAYALAARAGQMRGREALGGFGLALGLGLLLAAPWLVRNTVLYGDPLTLGIYRSTGVNFAPRDVMAAAGWSFGDYVRNVGLRSFATFWYLLPPDLPFRRFVGPPGPFLLALALALGGLFGAYRWRRTSPDVAERRVVALFLAGIVFLIPFFARFVLTVFQAQGRYFLPALLPAALLCCLGWGTLVTGRWGALLPGGILLSLALYALAGFPP